MTRLHLWTIVLIWTSAPRPLGRRLRTNMSVPALQACDADHSLQNDSERFRTFRLARQREVFDCRPDGPSTRSFSGGVAAGLSEHDGKPCKNVGPVAARQLHKFRFCRVRQAKFAPAFAYIQFNGYALKIEGIFLSQKCEHESLRPNDVQIFAHIFDFLTVPPPCDVKPPAYAGVDFHTAALSHRKQPFFCCFRVGPGIEDALRRHAERTREANVDELLGLHCDCLRSGVNPRLRCRFGRLQHASSVGRRTTKVEILSPQIGHDSTCDRCGCPHTTVVDVIRSLTTRLARCCPFSSILRMVGMPRIQVSGHRTAREQEIYRKWPS